MGAPLDPATLDEHLDRMLKHLYVEIDATDAQKQQLAPIVKGAARELLPLRAKMHDARRQAVELLSGESIDRAALETLRADQLKLAEQASKRFVQALADVADALTPEQRKQRSEEHTSELQSLAYLVCRLLLEKKKNQTTRQPCSPPTPSHWTTQPPPHA